MMIVENVIQQMEMFCRGEHLDIKLLNDCFNQYIQNDEAYIKENREILIRKTLECMEMTTPHVKLCYYYLFSFLFRATKDIKVYKKFLKKCIEDKSLTKENKFYLYNQCVKINFLESDFVDAEVSNLMDDLYSHVYRLYLDEICNELEFIPKEERDESLVIVLATQVLTQNHAPTKTLIDRCAVLERTLHKNVFIINTAELMSEYGMIALFQSSYAKYIDEYSNMTTLPIPNYEFPFFQCPDAMPQIPVIREIVDVIKSEKPYFILTIGGNSIVSDICSKIVPTITIGTVFSGRAVTRGQFQAIGRSINEDDRVWMKKHGYNEDHIIESFFTFVFKEQKHTYTREQLRLPADRFIVALVGGRLGKEVDEKCTELMLKLIEKGAFITLIGCFDNYEQYEVQYPQFKEHCRFLGFQEDVLAILEHCDLYINPRRIGGGSSASEALYKGVPVVSMNYGDVSVAVGSDFCVSDWDAMYEKSIQYMEDEEFYRTMSEKAKKRAALLTDSDTAFVKIIEEAEKRKGF